MLKTENKFHRPVKNNNNTNGASPADKKSWLNVGNYKFQLLIILLLTAIVFSNSINNGFVNWDDDGYVTDNPYLHDFSFKGIVKIFSEPYFSNYHPLTSLSYLLEYQLFGLNPKVYHFTNYLLHLVNTLLVFFLFRIISKRHEIPVITALLFAVHPMHVESVAWISERKDVLYTAFFLLSLIYWVKFIRNEFKPYKYYYISLLLFICSLISKSAAVILPVVMLLFIYFIKRKIVLKDIVKIIPFLALSVLFGVIAIYAQQDAMNYIVEKYSPLNRIFLIIYGVFFYLFHFIAPYDFSPLHLYPPIGNGSLPAIYFVSLVVLLLVTVCVFFVRKEFKHDLIFGLLFFLINLLLVIQIIPVGSAIVSERYTYVPYIGLSYILAVSYVKITDKFNKAVFMTLGFLFIAFLAFSSWQQNKVWKNGVELWGKAISVNPDNANAYYNRGDAFAAEKGDINKAYSDYSRAIKANPAFKHAYYKRGMLNSRFKKFEMALDDYNNFLMIAPDDQEVLSKRAWTYFLLNNYELAKNDFQALLKINFENVDALSGMAIYYTKTKDFNLSNKYINSIFKIDPQSYDAHYNLANNYLDQGIYDSAMIHLNKAIELKNDIGQYYRLRGEIKARYINDLTGAKADMEKAVELDKYDYIAYNNLGLVNIMMHNFPAAEDMFRKSIDIRPDYCETLINYAILLKMQNKMPESEKYFNMAKSYNCNTAH